MSPLNTSATALASAITRVLARWTPLVIVVVSLLTILFVPLAIVSHGFTPEDDVLSDTALAVSGRQWGDVMLIRPEFSQQLRTHAGWDWILRTAHHAGLSQDQLLAFAIAGLAFLVFLPGVLFLKRPECWLMLMGILVVIEFGVFSRFLYGRPYLFDVFCTSTWLLLWRRFERNPLHPGLLATFIILMILRVWIRSTLVMLGIPLAAIYASAWITGRWRPALVFTACVVVGILGGALLSGNPVDYLAYNIRHFYWTLFRPAEMKSLVTELLPLTGNVSLFLFAAGYVLVSLARAPDPDRYAHPAFILACLGWMLSFTIVRFWFEFGLPAFLVWAALDLQGVLEPRMRHDSPARLLLACFAAGTFALALLVPHREDWARSPIDRASAVRSLGTFAPDWLPGNGGIVYNPTMKIFFTFFYLYPNGPWKYAAGMEPGFMPPEDLRVYEAINRTGDADAYRPWAAKLRPIDRLVLKLPAEHPVRAIFPTLEWICVPPDYWFGRVPRPAAPAAP
ncbi:MAG: hypothetical protein K8T26_09725 [Lentisphaerae bacterium]|nr:hypothetical protein [Lentisphaerota bacterium]